MIMAGPLPPAVGGMASVLGALAASSLARRADLRLFETGKTTPSGRPLWQGVRARVALMADWWRQLGARRRPIVHIHTCSGFTFFLDGALLLLANLRRAPVVLHVHGARFDDFLDRLPAPLAAVARGLARRAAVVVVLSPEWFERLAPRWPGARLAVVGNGVAVPRRAGRVAEAGPAGQPVFAFLGNLGPRKGVPVLIEAAALAKEPWRVELAGGDEEPGATAQARSQAAVAHVDHRVRLLGPLAGDAKLDWLAAAQGFVLPSRAEGLPMALLEAMAVGLPVVVSDAGAMPEVVRAGVDGLVVPAGDAAALAAALDALARDPARRAAMGAAGAERCAARYGVERMVDELMGVYADAAGARR